VAPHESPCPPLLSQSSIVGEEVGDFSGLLMDSEASVLAILLDILGLLEGFDNVDILTEIDDDVLRANVQAVVEKSKRLEQVLGLLGWNPASSSELGFRGEREF
jgi:hypothetical protein